VGKPGNWEADLSTAIRKLRVTHETLDHWLDRLDQAQAPPGRVNARHAQRVGYRIGGAVVTVPGPDDTTADYAVAARNLSRLGMGAIVGQFIYPRSKCTVKLHSPHGREQDAPGRVVRCRYLVGSGSLHEIGVEFDRPLDVAVFAPQAKLIRVLVVDPAAATHALVRGFLHARNVELSCVTSETEALAEVAARHFDLVLVALDADAFPGFELCQDLRERSFIGPIVGLTAFPGPGLHKACNAAGCNGYLAKPLLREDLQEIINGLNHQPLVSEVADDPALAPLVDRFTDGLRTRAAELLQAFEDRDTARLTDLVSALRAEAASYGFPIITEDATYAEALINTNAPHGRVRRALRQVVHQCLRARPATSPAEEQPESSHAAGWIRMLTQVPGGMPPFAAEGALG
jgi:CheY-like chemotaxis protein